MIVNFFNDNDNCFNRTNYKNISKFLLNILKCTIFYSPFDLLLHKGAGNPDFLSFLCCALLVDSSLLVALLLGGLLAHVSWVVLL